MYELIDSQDKKRVYRSKTTGTEISTSVIYTDGGGANWWAFDDLLQIPFIRKKASENMTKLYGAGILPEDFNKFVASMKKILKENDVEKYEKAYGELLQFESLAGQVMDQNKQSICLCTVYILSDEERVDSFSTQEASAKMQLWSLDLDAQSFFLNWLNDGINDFMKHYKTISQIASKL